MTNTFDGLAYVPLAGDQVRVATRIYNYSTGQGFRNLLVRFQAVPYDASTDSDVGPRVTIGVTTVPALDPLGMTTAAMVWDTTGFGPGAATPCATTPYRIYVVLDPDNAIDEIYELEPPGGLGPGQNNEGYGYITIMQPSVSNGCPHDPLGADTSLHASSLTALSGTGPGYSDLVRTRIGQPLRLRISVHSNLRHRGLNHLLVFDREPRRGGQVIAWKTVHSGNPDGHHVWFDWMPQRPCLYRLHAMLVEDHDDALPGNNVAVLPVLVRRCLGWRSGVCRPQHTE